MIKIENVETSNWRAAVRGMRNPLESWGRSDSYFADIHAGDFTSLEEEFMQSCPDHNMDAYLGPNDLSLMKRLVNAGTDHSKFMRMITVSFDITAPLYFWKEFDTYRIGVVRNSCSTMHKIEARPLTIDDFATDGLCVNDVEKCLKPTINYINDLIKVYKETAGDKLSIHRCIVKLLPDSYLQRATITTNYQVLRSIRNSDRKTHKLLEWRDDFMKFIDSLPYAKELLIEDDAYKYEKAKMFIEKFDKEHGPLYKFLERAENPPRLCDDFDGDFDTEAESKAIQEALNGIKTYAEKKDPCEALTCCGPNYICKDLEVMHNPYSCCHEFTCKKNLTGITIPDDKYEKGIILRPETFNGEEF